MQGDSRSVIFIGTSLEIIHLINKCLPDTVHVVGSAFGAVLNNLETLLLSKGSIFFSFLGTVLLESSCTFLINLIL